MYTPLLARQNLSRALCSALPKGERNMSFRSSGNLRGKAPGVPTHVVPGTLDDRTCDVVLTREHEYFVLNGVCIAVRERSTGRYVRQDLSIGVASLHTGRIPPHVKGAPRLAIRELLSARETVRNMPRVGEWLCLERGGALHYIGPVVGCERRCMPSRRIVEPVLRKAKLD